MTELNATPESGQSDVDAQMAAAMASEMIEAADAAATEDSGMDDWASALAEQNNNAEVNPAAAGVFQPLSKVEPASTRNDIDMILDIPVQMTVELGRTKIAIRNLLQLAQGSVVELDGLAGEPMDVLVNGCLIAQGEVVVVNDKFGIRLTDIITPSERIRKLNR
nr:flagellar motor switch protein FliN [Trinickia mobilis]